MADDSKRPQVDQGKKQGKPERGRKAERKSRNSEPPDSERDGAPDDDDERPSEPPDRPAGAKERDRTPRKQRRATVPLTEQEIDAPNRQTLLLLGLVALLTLLLWGSAKAACNMRTQVTRPRAVTVQQIVRSPKHAAIELQQRWAKGDFVGAKELASASVAAQLDAERSNCDAGCLAARQQRSDKIFSTAYVIDASANISRVWVRTIGMADGEQKYVLEITRPDPSQLWKAISRRPAKQGELPVRDAPPATPQSESSVDGGVGDVSATGASATPEDGADSQQPATPQRALSPARSSAPLTATTPRSVEGSGPMSPSPKVPSEPPKAP